MASSSYSASAAAVARSSREIGYSTCERMLDGLLSWGSPIPRAIRIPSLRAFPESIYIPRRSPSEAELSDPCRGAVMEMKMTDRVKQILSWYASDNPGTLTNIARLLMHGRLGGTGKLVILPVDQGFEHGPARSFAPNPDGYDPRYHFQLAIEAGCNAYAAPLGFLEAGAAEFAGQIPLILKLNNSDSLYSDKDPCPAVTASVGDALR